MTTIPQVRPQDWARMSWHARNRYVQQINTTAKAARRTQPTRGVTQPLPADVKGCMALAIGLLDHALSEHGNDRPRRGAALDRALAHADDLARTDISGNALAFELGVTPSTVRRWRRVLAEVTP